MAQQVPDGCSVTVLAVLSSLCLHRRQHMQSVSGDWVRVQTVKVPAPEGWGVSDKHATHMGWLPCYKPVAH